MSQNDITDLVSKQQSFFKSGKTRGIDFRLSMLSKLLKIVKENETAISGALKADLGKPLAESFLGEVAFSTEEIKFAIKHIRSWIKPTKISTPFVQALGKSRIYSEPLGVVLVIGPWNYPFQLLISPLIGAVSAGNCAILKPSELAPATSKVIASMILQHFPKEYISVVEGGVEASTALLKEKFNHIFFTGGISIGKIVMAEAAKNLIPVTLELGGKSPCIVDSDTDLDVTARRITWGKFFNAGQTCVAPDYLLVPKELKGELIKKMGQCIEKFFSCEIEKSPDYGRIISDRHYNRLKSFLKDGTLAYGGKFNDDTRFISPTILTNIDWDSHVMQEEVFGPILPVLDYENLTQAITIVNSHPKPLALYYFSKNKANQQRIVLETSFGGGCINDTLSHLSNPRLPFGGVGDSGMGAYHGKYSFDTFSHKKSVFYKSFFPDLALRYPPYEGKMRFLRKLLG